MLRAKLFLERIVAAIYHLSPFQLRPRAPPYARSRLWLASRFSARTRASAKASDMFGFRFDLLYQSVAMSNQQDMVDDNINRQSDPP